MNEPLFGSVAPMWTGLPTPGFGWPATPGTISAGGRPAGFNSPQFPQANTTLAGGPQTGNIAPPDVFGFGAVPMNLLQPTPAATVFNGGFPLGPSAIASPGTFPAFTGPEIAVSYGISTLLAVVAMRRGQPMGPTNDQECEDFIYDALELIPGTSEVEVRCDNGRATLTGSVQHKRLKRDLGEIAWTIPAIADVQNNVTIATKRRSRSGRETEPPAGRKQG
jgi:BON domain